MDPLFQPLPEDIASLTDEQINDLIAANLEVVEQVKARDESVLKGRSTKDVIAEMTAGVAAIKQLREELTQRETIQAEAEAALDALSDEAIGAPVEDEDPETPVAEEPAAEPVEEPEAIAASGSRPFRTRPRVEPKPEVREPTPEPLAVMVASSGIDGIAEGSKLNSRGDLVAALMAKREMLGSTPEGVEEKVRVARAHFTFPEDRVLVEGDYHGNLEKVNNVVGELALGTNFAGEQAIIASGGLCAPVTPYYDLELIATTARPVRDMLPVFNAQRGGIRYATPPGLAAVTNGVGYLTAAQDQTGGTTGAKSCQQISCPSFTEVDVAMIYTCLRFGNLGSRAWPEQVTQFEGLAAAVHARLAERKLLDGIQAASTLVTGAQIAGANATLLGQILMAAAGQRNRNRMDPNAVLRVLLPAWVRELLTVDVIRSQFQRFDMGIDDFEGKLREFNVAPTWYIDGTTTGTQVFGAQNAGALLVFPTTVQWFIFPEGSFIYLDAGVLDIGIVRDSTLNLTNDFQVFSENFENVAFVGVESLQVISTVCPNGQVIAPVAASGCAS